MLFRSGEDARKMSKRWGNVVNPDDIVSQYGADSLRLYEMFMGPFEQSCAWSSKGLNGVYKFLEKIISLSSFKGESLEDKAIKSLLHKTIKKVSEDIPAFRFNTAVSAMMILVNEIVAYQKKEAKTPLKDFDIVMLIQILAPFAPHISEEIWAILGNKSSVFLSKWPSYDETLIKDETISLVVQVNGKLRGTLSVAFDIEEDDAFELVKQEPSISKWLEGKEVIKKIFVKGKLINIVIK